MSEQDRRLDELLGAYALDAVSDEERREIDEYLLVDPRARAEVQDHREVATMLAWTGVAAPEGLWERIAGQLDDSAPTPTGELAAVLAFDTGAHPRTDSARDTDREATAIGGAGVGTVASMHSSRRRSLARNIGAWAGVSAAAALVAVLVVNVVQDRNDGRSPIEAAVAQARNDRDSTTATLVAADGTVGGEAVIDQDGHGYLIADALPTLPLDRTYQLWGVINGKAISLGILGHAPEVETFSADGPITQLVITNEVAGGVISDGNPDGAFAGTLG